MGRVGSGAGEITAKDLGDSLFDSSERGVSDFCELYVNIF